MDLAKAAMEYTAACSPVCASLRSSAISARLSRHLRASACSSSPLLLALALAPAPALALALARADAAAALLLAEAGAEPVVEGEGATEREAVCAGAALRCAQRHSSLSVRA